MKRLLSIPAAIAALLLGGCNVYEGLYEAGSSNDPQILLVDAEQAMEVGDPQKAVEMLEKAAAKVDPESFESIPVFDMLGKAKLQVAGVGMLDLYNLMEDLDNRIELGSGASGKIELGSGGVCSFEAPAVALEEIALSQLSSFKKISDNIAVLEEVKSYTDWSLSRYAILFAQYNGEPIPANVHEYHRNMTWPLVEGRGINLSTGGGCTVGTPNCTAINRNTLAVLFNRAALHRAAFAIYDIKVAGGNEIDWYRVQSPTGYSIGYCAPSQQVLDEVRAKTACSLGELSHAADYFQGAADLSHSDTAQEIADLARQAYDHLNEELGGECPAPSTP